LSHRAGKSPFRTKMKQIRLSNSPLAGSLRGRCPGLAIDSH
jgi:hypothetical protein